MKKDNKIWAGKISTLIILIFEILSITYQIMGLNNEPLNAVNTLIEDASSFITIICISFIVMSVRYKECKLTVMSAADIILANHLYSNQKWLSIFQQIRKVDKKFLVFIVLVGVFAVIILDRILTTYTGSVPASSENTGNNAELQRTEGSYHYRPWSARIIYSAIVICISVILLGVLDYVIFNIMHLNIQRPAELSMMPDKLYYAGIISAAVAAGLVMITKIKPSKFVENMKGQDTFKLSAVITILLMGFLVYWGDKFDSSDTLEKFLSVLADNGFGSVFAVIVTFLILQIGVTILLQFMNIGHDQLTSTLAEKTTEIEQAIIDNACGIISGCVNLFNFIPDFFNTIGVLLLDKDIKTPQAETELKQSEQECEKNEE